MKNYWIFLNRLFIVHAADRLAQCVIQITDNLSVIP
jgi:hypothetical protein